LNLTLLKITYSITKNCFKITNILNKLNAIAQFFQIDKTTLDNANQLFYNQQLMNRQHLIDNCQVLSSSHNGITTNGVANHNNNATSLSSMGSSSNCDETSPAKFLADNMLPLSENELEQISVRELNKLLQVHTIFYHIHIYSLITFAQISV